ncbi:glycosyltransferase family 4 protein [Kallotenue papyrolyticum]|uniref:glycosyltransferase family 4 protein n=1 Tax=Kallotenue papyrolyticum TaxID=1325125 RepID=UPI000492943E|nr:MraY family glycosyltransferase [Kallotenue papyrolyticum]
MQQFLLIFIVALVFSVVGTPLARRLALASGVVDVPSARKVHREPTPLLGGAAIYLAFVLALLFFGGRQEIRQLVGILVGATLVSVVGVIDDVRGLRPLIKLLGQVIAAAILPLAGIRVQLLPIEALNLLLTLVWVVGITNALNLLDNMDGLSGGVAAIAAAHFLLLAVMNTPPQVLVGAFSAALLGACIGFVRYNFNPASIFMGDTGSLFLGFILAALAIKLRFLSNTYVVTWMVPVVVLLVPIFDTTLVTVSRLRRGRNPLTTPGKDHLSHRLVALGCSRREAVLIIWLVASSVGMLATFLTRAGLVEAYLVGGALLALFAYAIWWFERHAPGGAPGTPPADQRRS